MDPIDPKQWAENTAKLRDQLSRAIKASSKTDKMACVECGHEAALWHLYRCYECGCWYCQKCAGPHFGMVRPVSRLAPS
jgi:hypothetical protein